MNRNNDAKIKSKNRRWFDYQIRNKKLIASLKYTILLIYLLCIPVHSQIRYLTNKNNANIINSISAYSNSELILRRYYYLNGKIETEQHLKNYILNGITRMFSTNGMVATEMNYKDGEMSGYSKHYYQTGELESISIFSNGEIYKVIEVYDKKGELVNGIHKATFPGGGRIEGKCINGAPNGTFKVFNKEGELIIESSYKDGKPDGKWKYYGEDGKVTNEELYEEGKLK